MEELLSNVALLRQLLGGRPQPQGKRNGDVLRALFALVDVPNARLSARILHIILMVSILTVEAQWTAGLVWSMQCCLLSFRLTPARSTL